MVGVEAVDDVVVDVVVRAGAAEIDAGRAGITVVVGVRVGVERVVLAVVAARVVPVPVAEGMAIWKNPAGRPC